MSSAMLAECGVRAAQQFARARPIVSGDYDSLLFRRLDRGNGSLAIDRIPRLPLSITTSYRGSLTDRVLFVHLR
jgi:hypothetical protein